VTKAEVTRFPGVGKRADANTYQFALRVPKDVQQHFTGAWAVRCSLGTADLREANSKAKVLHAEWAARFDALRSGRPPPVDLVALRRKLLTYAERNYLPAADRMSAGYTPAERAEHAHLVAFARDAVLQGIEQGYAPEDADAWLTAMLGAQRSRVTEGEALPFFAMLLELRHESLTDSTRTFPLRVRRLAERRALLPADAAHPSNADAPARPVATPSGYRIADALAAWKTGAKAEKSLVSFTRHAAQFAELMGDPVLSSIDRAGAISFRDKLQQWAVEKKRTAVTADNVLVSIRALTNVARDRGWIEGNNPFERLTVKVGGKESEGREPWTKDELLTLFDDPLFLAYSLPAGDTAVGRKAGGAAAYWIPLMACYTGARVSELAQLRTDDVTTTEGAEVIEIRASAEHGQKLKTKGSWRAVPMHSELIRLGLPQYINTLPKGPLFPQLPQAGKNGPGGQFSQFFGDYKRRKGFKSPAKSLHSFRHLMATELRLAGATDAQADAITGHAGEGVARTVYSATIRREAARLRPVIEKLRLDAVTRLPVSFQGRRGDAGLKAA
jgi:integrase